MSKYTIYIKKTYYLHKFIQSKPRMDKFDFVGKTWNVVFCEPRMPKYELSRINIKLFCYILRTW